ncbi:MAG: rhomboid family intramembrane serine protease [Chlamydiales bacterium]
MSHPQYRLGPTQTPRSLKFLLFATFLISLGVAVFNNLFQVSLEEILGLSPWGIRNLYLWQFFTYLFVHPVGHGISFSFLLSLAFSLYLIWVMGGSIIQKRGLASFFSFFFSSGVVIGLAIWGVQELIGYSPLPFLGNTATIYALLMAWLMLYPDAQLLFLLALPLKAKWLILSILGANLFIDLAGGAWLNAAAYVCGAIFGYLYPLIFWKTHGPFHSLHPFETAIIQLLGGKTEQGFHPAGSRAKIYDFKTGRAILSDEEFADEMLSKIALHGKGSLTWRERFRLRRIATRKKKR